MKSRWQSAWQIGDKIQNRWKIQKILGGGMGIIFIATDPESGQSRAIKTYPAELFDSNPGVAKRFEQEALAWIRLDWHPNITCAFRVEAVAGRPFLFLEYVRGGNLTDWLSAHVPGENLPQVLRFAIQFCDGMRHIMSKGIKAHRDIKPENCLITEDQILKVTDFGLSKVFDGEVNALAGEPMTGDELEGDGSVSSLTRTGAAFGTYAYMAPEQFEDAKHVDQRADIYSFGVMLYEMVTGTRPFVCQAKDWCEQFAFYQQAHSALPPPALDSSVPALDEIVRKCLAKDPNERFADFGLLREILGECYQSCSGLAAPRPSVEDQRHYIYLNEKGSSLCELGQHEEAIAYFDKVLAQEQSNWSRVAALTNKARTLLRLRRMDEALACYERALEPDRMASWFGLSQELRSAFLAKPGYEFAFNGKGALLTRWGRYAEAVASFDKALQIDPTFAEAWVNKGSALLELARYDEARECFERALSLNQNLDRAWSEKGNLLARLKKENDALVCLDKALGINPQNYEALANKAGILSHSGRHEEAVAYCDKALKVKPTDALIWYNKGVILSQLGRLEEAVVSYDRALELQPQDAKVICNKTWTLRALRRFSEALGCCELLLQLCPQEASVWTEKGNLLIQLNRSTEALACCERALALNPCSDMAWFNKALALFSSNDFQQALTCFEEAARLGNAKASQGITICRRAMSG